jgi:2-alkenal reductase
MVMNGASRLLLLPLLCCGAFAAHSETPSSGLSPMENATIALFRHAAPSVVHIAIEKKSKPHGADDGEYGSGFIWGSAGHIVTNTHVVRDAQAIGVVLPLGKLVIAEVVGLAPHYDIAVLQVGERDVPQGLPLGDSSTLQIGQSVFAIGNPFGLDQTLTTGVVSALKRRTVVDGQHEIADAIQIDAAINPGNSGGPLLDSSGRLIGVNTAIVSSSGTSSGVGFAIPVATIKRVVPELIQSGHAVFPGVGVIPAPHSASVLRHVRGLVVANILPGSPASKAGLRGSAPDRIGDVIITANNVPIVTLADFADQLAKTGIGNSISITVVRGDQTKQMSLQVIDEAAE